MKISDAALRASAHRALRVLKDNEFLTQDESDKVLDRIEKWKSKEREDECDKN